MHNSYVWSVQHVEVYNNNGINMEMSICLDEDRENKMKDDHSEAQFVRL
jgi:hypothetical protein